MYIFFCVGMLGLPTRNGKIKDLSKFDATFFGVSPKQADRMDPQLRLLLETTYESIIDAGGISDLLYLFHLFII
jgi:fatty acid synthase